MVKGRALSGVHQGDPVGVNVAEILFVLEATPAVGQILFGSRVYCLSESRADLPEAFDSSRLAALLLWENPVACCFAAARFSLSFSTWSGEFVMFLFQEQLLFDGLSPRLREESFFVAQTLPGAEDTQQGVRLVVLLMWING